jgi:hypothetical protein
MPSSKPRRPARPAAAASAHARQAPATGQATPTPAPHSAQHRFASGPAAQRVCADLQAEQAEQLSASRDAKANQLAPCDDHADPGCGCHPRPGEERLVDLVVLMDSSWSMYNAAPLVVAQMPQAIATAALACPSNLRVTYMTVDGKKPGANPTGDLGDITTYLAGTPFQQTHQQYLLAIGAAGPFKQDEPQPPGSTYYGGEEGADAAADLARFFDWRPGACRSIFYISDEKLDSINASDASAAASAANAATVALANGVLIFAHNVGPYAPPITPEMSAYQAMCLPTGGAVHFGPIVNGLYVELIGNAICRACDVPCKTLDLSGVRPCVSLAWGDSTCDCFETDDFEVGILSLCNCYENLSFHDVHVAFIDVLNADGSAVATLPDGRPAVQVIPSGGLCFGAIGPCVNGQSGCASAEVVIRTVGAKAGPYKLVLRGLCFQIRSTVVVDECLRMTLCQD